jgi:hypothetical protein
MVMKMYTFGSLKELTLNKPTAPIRIANNDWTVNLLWALAGDVVSGISAIHEVGIVHNDIKVTAIKTIFI